MDPNPKVKYLTLFLRLQTIILVTLLVLSIPKGTYSVNINCLIPLVSDAKEINCTVQILNTKISGDYKSKCIKNNILQIVGEYGELMIKCSAPYALDFDYDGFQPTEAIQIRFFKRINANSSENLVSYNLEIKIQSIESLYQFYYNSKGQKEMTHTEKKRHSYSRTGKYTIRNVFNHTLHRSMYFFLEEGSNDGVVSLMRNKNTLSAIKITEDTYRIPCRLSHMNATMTLLPLSNLPRTYDPTEGWTINVKEFQMNNPAEPIHFECNLNTHLQNINNGNNFERRISSMKFTIPSNISVPFGFEGLSKSNFADNVNMDTEVEVINYQDFTVNLVCSVPNPEQGVLTVIEALSPSHSRLLQEFVFPEYANFSYSVKIGSRASPPGLFRIRNAPFSGLVFCTSGVDYKIQEYATGFDKGVRRFPYKTDWSAFDISGSPGRNHLQIGLSDNSVANKTLYVNKLYSFKCRVRTHGLVPPVVWYHKLTNQGYSEVYIDYYLVEGYSYIDLKIIENMTEIACAASFWDRDLWKNVSMTILPTKGILPSFLNIKPENQITFTVGAKNQVIKCEAIGDPIPELQWFNNSGKQVGTTSFGTTILEFPIFSKDRSGNYTCFASNLHGNASARFLVQTTKSNFDYGVAIGIPVFVFLAAVSGTYFYFRYVRKENAMGLTTIEIEEFENGCAEAEVLPENDYINQNALLIPYNKSYEIESDQFQISKSEILGSGAFGIVYRGILNGIPVAVKTIKPNAEKSYLKALLSEIKIMIYLGKHPHLIEMVGASTKELRKGTIYVFVELCPLGNLQKYLRKNRQFFIEDSNYSNVPNPILSEKFGHQDLYVWSCQISKGMEYLSSKRVIHGDLATRNVLLMGDKTVKITDFGLSRQLYNYSSYVKKNEEPLPWRWMAIESLRDLTFSCKSDVWSFGITLWEIFTLAEVPYPGYVWDLDFVHTLETGLRMRQPKYGTLELYQEILLPSWHIDSNQRPSFDQISQLLQQISSKFPFYSKTDDDTVISYSNIFS